MANLVPAADVDGPSGDGPPAPPARPPVERWSRVRRLAHRHAWLVVPLAGAIASRMYSTVLIALAASARHAPLLGPNGLTASWDARWYLGIAANGYHRLPIRPDALGGQHDYAFFPGWPLLIRALSVLPVPPADLAAVASPLLFCLAAILVAAALEPAYGRGTATDATVLLAFSPGAWVFSMGYSESLFLVCAALAFLARRPGPRALAVMAAVVTRVAGLPLVAVDAIRFLRSRGRDLGALLVTVAGTAAFAAWWIAVAVITGDPLGFLHGTAAWTTSSGPAQIVHVLYRVDVRHLGQLVLYGVVACGAILALRRAWPLGAYAVLALALGLLPGGVVQSMPRYALAAFPAFAGLAAVRGRRGTVVLVAISVVAQAALVAASLGTGPRLAP